VRRLESDFLIQDLLERCLREFSIVKIVLPVLKGALRVTEVPKAGVYELVLRALLLLEEGSQNEERRVLLEDLESDGEDLLECLFQVIILLKFEK
jgi:hypothetical protein